MASNKEIFDKYAKQLDINRVSGSLTSGNQDFSREFNQFKEDMMPSLSKYEKWCGNIGNIIKIKLAKSDEEKIGKEIEAAHLEVTPSQVVTLGFVSFLVLVFVGLMLSISVYLLTAPTAIDARADLGPSLLIFMLALLFGGFLFYYFYSTPKRLANEWRLKAGSQMVPCILYTVIYMKHTSNLERAIRFASQHLEPPLALDLRKVFWDVETGRFSTIKESLDNYLEQWRGNNSEFIESFNLIESSLFEPSEARRIQILERALQVILDGVYDRMLKFTHDVKAPLTNLYMLGIVLPTLGLALLPLGSALLQGMIKWYHVIVFFNLIIPFFVFYLTSQIMLQRPGGYGEAGILELNPLYEKYKSKRAYLKAGLIAFPLILIGLIPYILRIGFVQDWLNIRADYSFAELGISLLGDLKLFDFIQGAGPMGLVAIVLSLFIPLGVALFFAISYKAKTREIIKSRNESKLLEAEFTNSIFQLGNRISDGTPAELAFSKVAESARGQVTENFFSSVNRNIQGMGMGLEKAIFDSRNGAIINYPSNLIATSMHILVESVKKGLRVAAESLMSIADYVRNINKINDRLRDLLADVVSDMKSNMTFLAPLLAGVVVGLSSMMTLILSKLTILFTQASEGGFSSGSMINIGNIVRIFNVETMISPYILQISIGIYIIEIIFILTSALVTVDSGQDKLKETYDTGVNLLRGGLLYLIVSLFAIVVLSIIAAISLANLAI
jgi:hypothetical protein